MGIIAWALLGLVSGLLAGRLVLVGQTRRLIFPCLTGITGGVLGGWAAASLASRQASSGLFSLPAWLGALLGAAILLLAYRPLIGQPRQPADRIPVPVPVRRDEPRR